MSKSKIIAAVEIGAAKTVVLVGEMKGECCLSIIGHSERASQGVKKGEIIDFKGACEPAHAALQEAEKAMGIAINGVYLAQTGQHLQGFLSKGQVTVSAPNGIVSQKDVVRAVDEAKRKELAEGRVYIQRLPLGIFLDGNAVEDPFNLPGEQLEVAYWHIHADENKVRPPIHVINGFSLEVEKLIVSSLASACMALDEAECKHGVLLLDIGAGVTDYTVYRDNSVVLTGTVPIGGDHLTNDLSLGLRVSVERAEAIKCYSIDHHSNGSFPREAVSAIIGARVDELLSIVKKSLSAAAPNLVLAGGVVLTGGGARLQGLKEATEKFFETSVRLSDFSGKVTDELNHPEYSTVLGLLYYGMRAERAKYETQSKKNWWSKVSTMFQIN